MRDAFEELRELHRRAVEGEATKASFLRLASHELRTPLAVVRGYVDMIRAQTLGPLPDAVGAALAVTESKLREIDEVIGQMTEAARMQQGGPQLRLEPIDLKEVMADAIARTRDMLRPEHRLVVEEPQGAALVLGDRFRLRTVLVNLLGNAAKYSPEGGDIRCELTVGAASARIRISDQGVGIDAAQRGRLFQPFTRLAESQLRTPGLGLGLYVAREIAHAHDGELTAEANGSRGSTFVLLLPVAPPAGPALPAGEGTMEE